MKIVILDGYTANPGDYSWKALNSFGEVEIYDRTSRDEVIARAKDADMVLTNKVVLKGETLAQLPQLKYIGILATGYNIIDIDETRARGIVVTNVPAYSTDSVAQMTFAHVLNITNRIEHYADQNRKGQWSAAADFCYWDTPLSELAGKTFGIVGLGHIGQKVARIALNFGMRVIAFTSKKAEELPEGVEKANLEELLTQSDVLSLHCPLTENTREMINRQSLAKMKRGAILVNTGRGPLVNEADVAEALAEGWLAGYGSDVMSSEPPKADNPLLKQPNAFITPHIAWATAEARGRLMATAIENAKAFIAGKPQNVVNGL
jgi:S-adenosyl-L-homocysteine hydrolase, NAD binding domain